MCHREPWFRVVLWHGLWCSSFPLFLSERVVIGRVHDAVRAIVHPALAILVSKNGSSTRGSKVLGIEGFMRREERCKGMIC